jgi:hypothetical protein
MKNPANWHDFDDAMTIVKLVVQEARHTTDGAFPLIMCAPSMGEDVLIEVIRDSPFLSLVIYFRERSAKTWKTRFGFEFLERGWRDLDESNGYHTTIRFLGLKNHADVVGEALQVVFDLIQPETVMTGVCADPTYTCPHDYE